MCPVNCFYEGPNYLVIQPDECIDCGACEPVCPTKAIYPDSSLPPMWDEYKALNTELSAKWPVISTKKAPPPEAGSATPPSP